jgi:hypothetical protein
VGALVCGCAGTRGPAVVMLGTGSERDENRNGSWSDRNRRVTEREIHGLPEFFRVAYLMTLPQARLHSVEWWDICMGVIPTASQACNKNL